MGARRPLPGGNVRPLAESGPLTCSATDRRPARWITPFPVSLATAEHAFAPLVPPRSGFRCDAAPEVWREFAMESVANLAREQRQPGGCTKRSANAPKPTRTRGGRIPGRDLE